MGSAGGGGEDSGREVPDLQVTRGLTFSLEAPVSSVILHVLGNGEVNGGKEGHWGTLYKSDFLIPLFFPLNENLSLPSLSLIPNSVSTCWGESSY